MRIIILDRSYENAGDKLILNRTIELLSYFFLNVEIRVESAFIDIPYELLNQYDLIVFAGGPMIDNRYLCRDTLPVFKNLDRINTRFILFGVGWNGITSDLRYVYNYSLSKEVKENLRCIYENNGRILARDYLTVRVLNNNGFSAKMTGCPAWYDVNTISSYSLRVPKIVKRLIISDQQLTKNSVQWSDKFEQIAELLSYAENKFKEAKITFTFNNGITTKYSTDYNNKIVDLLDKHKIEYYDISGSDKGFALYDTADLHIGFRCHSHIYCLSRGIPSILIEEDARGFGVNHVFSLPHIRNYSYGEGDYFTPNEYLIDELDMCLEAYEKSAFESLRSVPDMIRGYYEELKKTIIPMIKG